LIENPEGKRPLGRIKMDPRERERMEGWNGLIWLWRGTSGGFL
jgi:hypothetical protein